MFTIYAAEKYSYLFDRATSQLRFVTLGYFLNKVSNKVTGMPFALFSKTGHGKFYVKSNSGVAKNFIGKKSKLNLIFILILMK